jgi:hypothetical protein
VSRVGSSGAATPSVALLGTGWVVSGEERGELRIAEARRPRPAGSLWLAVCLRLSALRFGSLRSAVDCGAQVWRRWQMGGAA